MTPYAKSLIITPDFAHKLFEDPEDRALHAPPYLNGSDVARISRDIRVVDFFAWTEEELQQKQPAAYQYLYDHAMPERSQERNARIRREWWSFESNRPTLRKGIAQLSRYIVTVENSPRRYFVFVPGGTLPDQKLRVVCSDDAWILGVLSSYPQALFSRRQGGRHGVGNTPVYNTRCATQFPTPACGAEQQETIRQLGERIDAHRKTQKREHEKLTLTNVYNVLEKLRSGEPLTPKEKLTHEQGLVSVLKQLHDDLDAAVFAAYGWSDLGDAHQQGDDIDEPLLERLVALNAVRAAEEATGHVRWLRPDFQNPQGKQATPEQQTELDLPDAPAPKKPSGKKLRWPDTLPAQTAILRDLLTASPTPLTPEALAASFPTAITRLAQITEICETLTSLGLATRTEDAAFAA